MSILEEAAEHYRQAVKLGKKCYRDRMAEGQYPYLQVLDEIFDESLKSGHRDLGLIDIPTERIVGTKTAGRKSAFAANFMPLLEENSEFGQKWIHLCAAHLSDEGIRDPITCYEYLGRFYVLEGNKRASVLKSFGAATVPGHVTRLIPAWSEDDSIRLYYEFLEYYELSRLYYPVFSKPGAYRKFLAALGHEPGHVWTEEERRSFSANYHRFCSAWERLTGSRDKVGDGMLTFFQVFSPEALERMTEAELDAAFLQSSMDVEAQSSDEPIDVSLLHDDDTEKGTLSKLVSAIFLPSHVRAAFVHAYSPAQSPWILAHEQGREYAAQVLGDRVSTAAYYPSEGVTADALIDRAVADGAEVIFTTTPPLISACRRAAARYPDVKLLNCSVSMPFPEIRTYYSRIYEGKFISGAIAGAITKTGRIGYVASNPIFGVPAGINAFALGASLTNPEAKIILKWSATSVDTFSELRERGVDLISNRDIPTPTQAQDVWGLCSLAEDGAMTPLCSPYWNWGEMYVKILQNILAGGWDELSFRNTGKAVNYWWGISSGVVDIELTDAVPESLAELVRILKSAITSGILDPFQRVIYAQDGTMKNDGSHLSAEEILNMDWLCSSVDGHIPFYDELLPIARNIVSLQGIYRDAFAPGRGGGLL